MIDLETLCKNYKIIIDTSALMIEGASTLYGNIYINLYKTNTKIILPKRVYDELLDQAKQENSKKKLANEGLKFIKNLVDSALIDVHGEENEVVGGSEIFADALFPMVFSKFRLKYNLCLITQDTNLARDMLNLKYSRSVLSHKEMRILYIDNKNYELNEWEERLERTHGITWKDSSTETVSVQIASTYKTTNQAIAEKSCQTQTKPEVATQQVSSTLCSNKPQKPIERFGICSSPLSEKEQLLPVGQLPVTGEYVYTLKQDKIKLVKFIASGGEGELFETDNGLVCKIYKLERLTNLRKRKLLLMLSKNISVKGVCLPKELVFNAQKQFVGCLMEYARGHILLTSVFGKPALQNKFPEWKREHLAQLALTITRTIAKLHNRNIIIGDINPSNILVEDENNVFFVDTDSYQIENFPCPVGTPTFTSPDLQGVNYADILRTTEQEMFAVATLIFMILFPGKTPYSSQGGSDLIANIQNHNFSYVREEGEADKKPFGVWPIIWSHLHFGIRENFIEIFANGGQLDIKIWQKALMVYLREIRDGKSSNELFPSSYKVPADGIEIKCTRCNKLELVSKIRLLERHGVKIGQYKCLRCRGIEKLGRPVGMDQPNKVKLPQQTTVSSTSSTVNQQHNQTTNIPSGTSHTPKSNQTQQIGNTQQQNTTNARSSSYQPMNGQYQNKRNVAKIGIIAGALIGFTIGVVGGGSYTEITFLTIAVSSFIGKLGSEFD